MSSILLEVEKMVYYGAHKQRGPGYAYNTHELRIGGLDPEKRNQPSSVESATSKVDPRTVYGTLDKVLKTLPRQEFSDLPNKLRNAGGFIEVLRAKGDGAYPIGIGYRLNEDISVGYIKIGIKIAIKPYNSEDNGLYDIDSAIGLADHLGKREVRILEHDKVSGQAVVSKQEKNPKQATIEKKVAELLGGITKP